MGRFKPQVRYMTSESLYDFKVERYGVKSPYTITVFKTYTELKKALKDYILDIHIGSDEVVVNRSRRGQWGEYYEKWTKINGKPTITKKGWQ
jgi:hypothetical protein